MHGLYLAAERFLTGRLTSRRANGTVEVTVDDDGPGLDPALRVRVLQRGARADETAPGSGLGLAIVADLAEMYGGTITLDRSPLGGVRARLRLRAAVAGSRRIHGRGEP